MPKPFSRTRPCATPRTRRREHSPLQMAEGAIELDTTGLSVDQVVERIAALVAEAS